MTNKNLAPEIKPINTGITQYNTKQSKYDNAAKLSARSIILGPSGSGKTVLLTNLILDGYRKCFLESISSARL